MEHIVDKDQDSPKIHTLGKGDNTKNNEDSQVAPLKEDELKQVHSLHAKILKYKECFPTEIKDIDFNSVAEYEDLDFLEGEM